MTIQGFLRVLRSHWLVILTSTVVGAAGAVAVTMLTTPLYQASTRLYVAAAASGTANEDYQGVMAAQQRAHSYIPLITGQSVAQRTVDALHLDMGADELRAEVKANAAPESVLIDISVVDRSPSQARDIANSVSDEFVAVVTELEAPPKEGVTPNARVSVEQRASLPTEPIVPNTPRNLTLGVALGILLGLSLAFLRELFNNKVRDQQVLEELTGAGLVANIPLDKARRNNPAISFAGNHSAIAEAFREIRTMLQFFDVDDPPRAIVVTSSLPSEGRSTTAMNIALALAEADQNVVLVEGDMRGPRLHSQLEVMGSVGFSTVLTGEGSLPEVLQKTRFPGLTALTSGPAPPNPSELLGSPAAKKIMSELRGAFDFVIIDSSPLLAATDATVLAAQSDGVLMISRFGKTKRDELARAIGKLEIVGARILGSIFTMMPAREIKAYYRAAVRPSASHRAGRTRSDGRASDHEMDGL